MGEQCAENKLVCGLYEFAGLQRLPGQLTAEEMDGQLRRGHM